MKMQLRQCFSRAKPFKSGFFISKNPKGVQKNLDFKNLASKKPNWQSWSVTMACRLPWFVHLQEAICLPCKTWERMLHHRLVYWDNCGVDYCTLPVA